MIQRQRAKLRTCMEHWRLSVLKLKYIDYSHNIDYGQVLKLYLKLQTRKLNSINLLWIDKPTNRLNRQIQGNICNTYSVF